MKNVRKAIVTMATMNVRTLCVTAIAVPESPSRPAAPPSCTAARTRSSIS
jgi:hypothetical protein